MGAGLSPGSSLLMAWEKQRKMAQAFVPDIYVGDTDEDFGFSLD